MNIKSAAKLCTYFVKYFLNCGDYLVFDKTRIWVMMSMLNIVFVKFSLSELSPYNAASYEDRRAVRKIYYTT